MHGTEVVAPIAVLPPDVTVNAGNGACIVRDVTVVADVLPNEARPEGKENTVLTMAPVTVGDTPTVVSATATAGGASLPPPPPQALNPTTAATASKTPKAFIFLIVQFYTFVGYYECFCW